MDLQIVGPVACRFHKLDEPCAANQGHKHNYDHVTVARYGDLDVDITEAESAEVVATYPLSLLPISHDHNAEYVCAGLRLRRFNFLPDESIPFTFRRHTAFLALQGDIRIGGKIPLLGGENFAARIGVNVGLNYDTLLTSQNGGQLLVVEVNPEQSTPETFHGGDFCFVHRERWHNVKSRSARARYVCVYPHRDLSGIIVETYEAAMGNQAAYE